jgi:hypothetical protein
MTSEMELVVDAGGDVRCIYDEALDLRELGKLQITRASHVEPDAEGCWWADMGPSGGPVLGPFRSRSDGLAAERHWLRHDALPVSLQACRVPSGTQNFRRQNPEGSWHS